VSKYKNSPENFKLVNELRRMYLRYKTNNSRTRSL